METKNPRTHGTDREGKGYTIQDLIEIGDHLHNSKTAIVICDVEKDGGKHETMLSLTGKRGDIIMMLINILEQDDAEALEDALSEALVNVKMKRIHKMFTKGGK